MNDTAEKLIDENEDQDITTRTITDGSKTNKGKKQEQHLNSDINEQ